MESDTVVSLLLDYGKLLLWIIILIRVPECVVCELDEVRDGTEGILIRKKTPCECSSSK